MSWFESAHDSSSITKTESIQLVTQATFQELTQNQLMTQVDFPGIDSDWLMTQYFPIFRFKSTHDSSEKYLILSRLMILESYPCLVPRARQVTWVVTLSGDVTTFLPRTSYRKDIDARDYNIIALGCLYWAQMQHFMPNKSPAGLDFGPSVGSLGSELCINSTYLGSYGWQYLHHPSKTNGATPAGYKVIKFQNCQI